MGIFWKQTDWGTNAIGEGINPSPSNFLSFL